MNHDSYFPASHSLKQWHNIQDFDVSDSSLVSLLVIRRHIPVERTYVSGGVITFVDERFGDACGYQSVQLRRLDYSEYTGKNLSMFTSSRLSHALHTSHTRSCTNTTIFRACHICSLRLILLKDVFYLSEQWEQAYWQGWMLDGSSVIFSST